MESCPEVANYFYCNDCDYKTSKTSSWKKHLMTSKHQNTINTINSTIQKDDCETVQHKCSCGKTYKHYSSLWNHKKSCKGLSVVENYGENISEKELIMLLLKENKEFKQLIIEQTAQMMELATIPKTTNNNNNSNVINNNNCTNNQFNLNLFLNEKCKNAMNMSEFIDSIQIEDEDFENIGKLGYVQGISNIFVKGLKGLDVTMRPMHCSDIKRETLYIKDNDTWNKDDTKQKVRNAIAMVAHKNFKYIPVWQEANPSAYDVTTKKNELYMRIANQVTTCITPDDSSGINKIIRNLANCVCIDKTV
uniref:C2H2-type domain-containing protein n=1 Tax=viral metagenome TaxID=1070528 RepID=A0A6C0HCX0_9ZZZZ